MLDDDFFLLPFGINFINRRVVVARMSFNDYINNGPPLSAPQARLLKFYREQDEFFPFSLWPDYVKIMALKYKSYRDRYRFMLFLVANGLPSLIAEKWVLAGDFKFTPGKHVTHEDLVLNGQYDGSAHAHVKSMVRDSASGKIFRGVHVFDVSKGHVIKTGL